MENNTMLRKNFSSPTLWHYRSKCAASGTGCITLDIETLNRIDKECAAEELGTIDKQPTNSQSLQLQNNIIDALIHDIKDRRGLKWEWEKIDADVVNEIRAAWLEILQHAGV